MSVLESGSAETRQNPRWREAGPRGGGHGDGGDGQDGCSAGRHLHDFGVGAVGARRRHLDALDVLGVNALHGLQALAAQLGDDGRPCGESRPGERAAPGRAPLPHPHSHPHPVPPRAPGLTCGAPGGGDQEQEQQRGAEEPGSAGRGVGHGAQLGESRRRWLELDGWREAWRSGLCGALSRENRFYPLSTRRGAAQGAVGGQGNSRCPGSFPGAEGSRGPAPGVEGDPPAGAGDSETVVSPNAQRGREWPPRGGCHRGGGCGDRERPGIPGRWERSWGRICEPRTVVARQFWRESSVSLVIRFGGIKDNEGVHLLGSLPSVSVYSVSEFRLAQVLRLKGMLSKIQPASRIPEKKFKLFLLYILKSHLDDLGYVFHLVGVRISV